MKKNFNNILIFSLLLPGFLFAQDTSSVRFGLKTGANFAFISGAKRQHYSDLSESFRKWGYIFGVVADFKLKELSSIQLELLYNDAGSKWGMPYWPGPQGSESAVYDLHYISLIGYIKLKSNIGSFLKDFDFAFGIAYSYNIRARQEWFMDTYSFYAGPMNIRGEINKHEFGIIYGIKIPYKSGSKLYLSLLFYNSLSNLYPWPYTKYEDDFYSKNNMKNNSFSVSFEYFLF